VVAAALLALAPWSAAERLAVSSYAPGEDGSLLAAVDRVAERYGAPPWDAEVARAREEYDRLRGRVFDDDELFAQHMALFIEWYVLDRALPAGQRPIAEAVAEARNDEERELLVALLRSYRSLFEVRAAQRDGVLLVDLIRGGHWRVACTPSAALGAEEILEARLVPWRGGVCFGPAALAHPRAARPLIHGLLAQRAGHGALGPEVIHALAEMRLRFSRFRNIAIQHIYKEGDPRRG
jgi:hypothetical protein